jgi:hypothetical protein
MHDLHSDRTLLPRATGRGRPIRYEIAGLGSPEVVAVACELSNEDQPSQRYDISESIRKRQSGEDRYFVWQENFFDLFIGSYTNNPKKRNWAGSDLSGGARIRPGGVGDVTVPCADALDCISKKHDIQFWLSANFELGCEVQIKTEKGIDLFTVRRRSVVNLEAILGYIGAVLRPRRQA